MSAHRWHAFLLPLAFVLALATPQVHAKGGSSNPKPTPQKSALDTSLSPAQATQKLNLFREKVRTAVASHKTPVVVFDVDDTLVRVFGGKAVPGAAAYVNALLDDGATIVYQCGRKESQRTKTAAQLTGIGVPVNAKAQLWLKPQKEKASTLDWKKSQKPEIQALGFPVGFFDNEKCNSRMFRKEFPQSCVFRLNTSAYYPDPGGTGTIWVVSNYSPAP